VRAAIGVAEREGVAVDQHLVHDAVDAGVATKTANIENVYWSTLFEGPRGGVEDEVVAADLGKHGRVAQVDGVHILVREIWNRAEPMDMTAQLRKSYPFANPL